MEPAYPCQKILINVTEKTTTISCTAVREASIMGGLPQTPLPSQHYDI